VDAALSSLAGRGLKCGCRTFLSGRERAEMWMPYFPLPGGERIKVRGS